MTQFTPLDADPEFGVLLSGYLQEAARRVRDAIETMCKQTLAQESTDHGVLVQHHTDGTVTVTLSPEVPFGQIEHHHDEGAWI